MNEDAWALLCASLRRLFAAGFHEHCFEKHGTAKAYLFNDNYRPTAEVETVKLIRQYAATK